MAARLSNKLNMMLFIVLVVIIGLIFYQASRRKVEKSAPIKNSKPQVHLRREAKTRPTTYEIQKNEATKSSDVAKSPRSMREVFESFPREDVGDDMTEIWAKTNTTDKAKFMEAIDREIADSKELLKADPDNRREKGKLFISDALKKAASADFNYEQ